MNYERYRLRPTHWELGDGRYEGGETTSYASRNGVARRVSQTHAAEPEPPGIRDIGVHPRRINEIVLGKRSITADTALRLARYFGTSPQFWLGLQADYDLDVAMDVLGDRLEREVKTHASVG
jgi:plasmid maintenance system antidote protein VapI